MTNSKSAANITCDNFYERTEEWGRVGVEGESGVDFMGGVGWGGQRTISSRRGSLLKFVGGVFQKLGTKMGDEQVMDISFFRSKFVLA